MAPRARPRKGQLWTLRREALGIVRGLDLSNRHFQIGDQPLHAWIDGIYSGRPPGAGLPNKIRPKREGVTVYRVTSETVGAFKRHLKIGG